MSRSLVIGADAVIGAALYAMLKAGKHDVIGTSRGGGSDLALDLADRKSWPPLPQADVAYICAAISKLDDCERNPETAYRVNVEGTSALIEKLQASGTFCVFLSSNHVFDGTKPQRAPDDIPCPINEYGRQKAATERAALAAGAAVLRLTKVIVKGDPRIRAWHEALQKGNKVTAFDDIFLAPVTLDNALAAMLDIGAARAPGIYQISGSEDFSYFDLARGIAQHIGADSALVEHGSGAAAGVPKAFRPRYSSYRQTLPRPIAVPGMQAIIAYALS